MSRYHLRVSTGMEHTSADFAAFICDLLSFDCALPGAYCELDLRESKAVARILELRSEVMHWRALSERKTLPPPGSDEWDRRSESGVTT